MNFGVRAFVTVLFSLGPSSLIVHVMTAKKPVRTIRSGIADSPLFSVIIGKN
jgi:hypothetical protein